MTNVYGPIFFRGGGNFSTAPEKLLFKTAKLLCPTHPTEKLLVKIPDSGQFMLLDGMNSVSSFNKYNFFSFLAAGFCPKNLACPKYNGFARVRGRQPPSSWLVRLCKAQKSPQKNNHGKHQYDKNTLCTYISATTHDLNRLL